MYLHSRNVGFRDKTCLVGGKPQWAKEVEFLPQRLTLARFFKLFYA